MVQGTVIVMSPVTFEDILLFGYPALDRDEGYRQKHALTAQEGDDTEELPIQKKPWQLFNKTLRNNSV